MDILWIGAVISDYSVVVAFQNFKFVKRFGRRRLKKDERNA